MLMTNVFWTLGGKRIAAYDEFIRAVSEYNQKISAAKTAWKPSQVVATGPITVVYEAMWKDEDDTIEVKIGEPGKSLTMGEILFALNNETADLFEGADHRFFEGLSPVGGGKYELVVGS
jgi:hypothetical protein